MDDLQTFTLVVALIGALTGVASLVWSVVSHVKSGVRVEVDFTAGYFSALQKTYMYSDATTSEDPPSASHVAGIPVVGITVRNVGRLPARVASACIGNGSVIFKILKMVQSPPMPALVDVSDEARWYFDFATIERLAVASATEGRSSDMLVAEIRLGSGSSISSAEGSLTRVRQIISAYGKNLVSP